MQIKNTEDPNPWCFAIITSLRYKKFLCCSHCMVGIARNRKFFVESYKAAPLNGLRDVKNIYQILNFIELLCLENEKNLKIWTFRGLA